jgi:hypothetical protein
VKGTPHPRGTPNAGRAGARNHEDERGAFYEKMALDLKRKNFAEATRTRYLLGQNPIGQLEPAKSRSRRR